MPEGLLGNKRSVASRYVALKKRTGFFVEQRRSGYSLVRQNLTFSHRDHIMHLGAVDTFQGCCGIAEWFNLPEQHPSELSEDDFLTVLARTVLEGMADAEVRSVIATTVLGQKRPNIYLPQLGFVPQFITKNPKTKKIITFWLYTEG